MLRLLLFLAVVVLLALVAAWLADNPGRVALTWQGMRIQTSVALLAVGLLVVAVLVAAVFEIVRLLSRAPRAISQRRHRSRASQGYHALAQGMVAAAAGDRPAAKYLARRADKLLDHAPETLLLGAQTAQLEGDEGGARLRFQQMLKHSETEFLGLRGLLAQAIKDGDHEGALKLARRAHLRRPHTPWVLTTLFDLQTRMGLWDDALATVSDMVRHKVIDRGTATRRRAILYHQAAAAERTKGRPYEALRLAQKAHKLQPSLAPIAVQASEIAEQVAKPRVGRKVLELSWKAQPHPALARSYLALVQDGTPAERFRQIERLYNLQQGPHLEGEIALAGAALGAQKWDVARASLERALKLEPTASVYRLLAELEQADGGNSDKARAWLAKAVDAPPDPAWICETTGEVRASWSPFGPDGRFDSLRWGSPPKIVPLLDEGAQARLILPETARATAPAAGDREPRPEVAPVVARTAGDGEAAKPAPATAVTTVAGPDAPHDTREAAVAKT